MTYVLAESRIERHLEDNPPTEANVAKSRDELQEALQQLEEVLKGDPKVELFCVCFSMIVLEVKSEKHVK